MLKVLGLGLSAVVVLLGCITSSTKYASLPYSKDDGTYISNKGLTRGFAHFAEDNPDFNTSLRSTANDPYIIQLKSGKTLDCNTQLRKRTVTFKGKNYTKFIIDDSNKLKCPQVRAFKTDRPWRVTKTEWTESDEKGFSDFVTQLAASKCRNTDTCLSGPGNPFRSEEDMLNVFYSDCADLPYYLRAYYAYKKGLPFSFVYKVTSPDLATKPDADLRYTRGNIPVSRVSIPSPDGSTIDFGRVSVLIVDVISSAFFRMSSGNAETGMPNDFYSPRIQSGSVKPGTAVYAVGGHVGIIHTVDSNGEVLIMDAHPDNSITYKKLSPSEYVVDSPKKGGNFKNFRPLKLVDVEYNQDGSIKKARTVVAQDNEIADFSMEQYDSKNFVIDGRVVKFLEWQKYRLSGGTYKVVPTQEIANEIQGLCSAFNDRLDDIGAAVNNSLHLEPHIEKLPNNIFGAHGDWENYSTPSRDLRLRHKVFEIVEIAKELQRRHKAGDPVVQHLGSDIKADMIAAYRNAAKNCTLTYKKSDASTKTLQFEDLLTRLNYMSFDPYLCPELRWGATTNEELASCKDNQEKREWHQYTQFLRNSLVKDTKEFHGFTLDELKRKDTNKEVDNRTNINNYDLEALLQAI